MVENPLVADDQEALRAKRFSSALSGGRAAGSPTVERIIGRLMLVDRRSVSAAVGAGAS
ncbi:MAG: hypothetical protein JJU36_17835 [Phycisphaeraceae bacterium]|nr:hypothetical protein [Phycisphaeraceae bacterium]